MLNMILKYVHQALIKYKKQFSLSLQPYRLTTGKAKNWPIYQTTGKVVEKCKIYTKKKINNIVYFVSIAAPV